MKTDVIQNEIDSLLESKRNLMIKVGLAEGLSSPNVIRISREVDQLIYTSMTDSNKFSSISEFTR